MFPPGWAPGASGQKEGPWSPLRGDVHLSRLFSRSRSRARRQWKLGAEISRYRSQTIFNAHRSGLQIELDGIDSVGYGKIPGTKRSQSSNMRPRPRYAVFTNYTSRAVDVYWHVAWLHPSPHQNKRLPASSNTRKLFAIENTQKRGCLCREHLTRQPGWVVWFPERTLVMQAGA